MNPQLSLAEQLREDRDRGAIKPIEPNQAGLVASKILRGIKSTLNYPGKLPKWVPLLGDMGAGDLIMGEGPEYAEDLAYGFGKGKGAGLQRRLDPRIMDLVGTPTFGAVAGGKLLANQIRKGATAMVDPIKPVNQSRRKALKQMGGLAAGAAAATQVPDILKHTLPGAIDEVAPAIAKEVLPQAGVHAATASTKAMMDEMVEAAFTRSMGPTRSYIDEDMFNILEFADNIPEDAKTRIMESWSWEAMSPADQKLVNEIMEPHYKVGDEVVRNQIIEAVEDAFAKYGSVDPSYLDAHVNGVFRTPLPEGVTMTPRNVRLTTEGMSVEDLNSIKAWVKSSGHSPDEVEKWIVTGMYPDNFPKITIDPLDMIREFIDARRRTP